MNQTSYCPDKFGTYLSHPESLDSGIDLSDASVREIILAYRAYRQTLNPSFNNDHILRRVIQLEKEFSCTLMPSQITDVFYANFIQWAIGMQLFLSLHTLCSRNTATVAHTPAPCQTTTVICILF